uniref:Uncharacterized protein n=1 Tax=viral metagenome TaxID=1070528 RepID=A0A6M3Y0V3_9ZZZZ
MIHIKTTKQLQQIRQKGYDEGVAKGYELGFLLGKIERTNRGAIIGSKVDEQIKEIMERGEA